MSAHAEFLRELDNRLAERAAELTKQIVVGLAVRNIEDYRERVGELRGLTWVGETIRETIEDVEKRSTK